MSGPTVAEQVATLREQGFVVVRGFAAANELQALRELSQRQLEQAAAPVEYEADLQYPGAPASRQAEGGHTVRRLLDAYGRDPLYRKWATSPRIAEWLRACFGQRPVLSTTHHNCVMTKHPRFGSLTGWHQDIRYWSFSAENLVSTWLALGDEYADNGGLFFLPGSHSAAFQPSQFDGAKFFVKDLPENQPWIERAVCPELAPGDVVFFHCRTLHAARGNASDRVKLSLVHTYYPSDTKPLPGTRSASKVDIPLD